MTETMTLLFILESITTKPQFIEVLKVSNLWVRNSADMTSLIPNFAFSQSYEGEGPGRVGGIRAQKYPLISEEKEIFSIFIDFLDQVLLQETRPGRGKNHLNTSDR